METVVTPSESLLHRSHSARRQLPLPRTAQPNQRTAHFRPLTMAIIRFTTAGKLSLMSCSQTRITVQPARLSAAVCLRSLARFISILASQNAVFERGRRGLHEEQPCQKQPSAKTATLPRPKMKSGVPGNSDALIRQPRIPARTSARRNRPSVVLLPLPFTARMTLDLFSGTFENRPPAKWRRSSRSMEQEYRKGSAGGVRNRLN